MGKADIAALLAVAAAFFIAVGDVIHQRCAHEVTDEPVGHLELFARLLRDAPLVAGQRGRRGRVRVAGRRAGAGLGAAGAGPAGDVAAVRAADQCPGGRACGDAMAVALGGAAGRFGGGHRDRRQPDRRCSRARRCTAGCGWPRCWVRADRRVSGGCAADVDDDRARCCSPLVSGALWGLFAVLTKGVVDRLDVTSWAGVGALLGTPELYAWAVVGVAGTMLQQASFRSGALTASLPTMTVAEPVVASRAGRGGPR